MHGYLVSVGKATIFVEYLVTLKKGIQVFAILSEITISPVFKVCSHLCLEFTLYYIRHWWHELDRLVAYRQIEAATLKPEVDVVHPFDFAILLRIERFIEVVANGASLEIVVIFSFLMIIIREYHIY